NFVLIINLYQRTIKFIKEYSVANSADLVRRLTDESFVAYGHSKRQNSIGAKHLVELFTRVKRKISNGLSKEFNSRIQKIKMVIKGFKSFRNYRVSILFYHGALDVNP
ncbi:MAG: transposase, partial [Candidatus Marinimicrobia bacterium]|nr:transposase [Candidatus Neomarinimicrobiota bacterium]